MYYPKLPAYFFLHDYKYFHENVVIENIFGNNTKQMAELN
jgi:hypothetical protein